MHVFRILILLVVANGTPALLGSIFSRVRFYPLDGNRRFSDGCAVLGKSKTMVGFLAGIAAGGIGGWVMGLSLTFSFLAAMLSMLGDGLSSFIKRRLGFVEGTNFPVLDQLFEGGLPLLMVGWAGVLSWGGVLLVLVIFTALGIASTSTRRKIFSPPPVMASCRIRSRYFFREWRACHTALSPFARYLNFENVIYYGLAITGFFKCLGMYDKGVKNALDVRVKTIHLTFPQLPAAFNSYRILFISDLHIDGIEGLDDRLIEAVSGLNADICLLGGDYRMKMYGQFQRANQKLRRLVKHIDAADGIFGVLGNHDCLEIAPDLEDAGICMLINDAYVLEKNGQKLSVVGVDDPHYYKCDDIGKAYADVPADGFVLLLAHSPEIIRATDRKKIDLCLCGHTHGGQIRLPFIGPVFTHSNTPRRFSSGLWQHQSMTGYTSYGAGSSGVPVRFNCPPEVVLLTLSKP
jgi:predicted MPP superfamily phosphohydrolase